MTDDLDLVRRLAPPTSGPDAALVNRERAALLALAGTATRPAAGAVAPTAGEDTPPVRDLAPVGLRACHRRRALTVLGAAAAAALVVGVLTLRPDESAQVDTAGQSAPADAATQAIAAYRAFDDACTRGDKDAAWALTGPLSQARLAEMSSSGNGPDAVIGYMFAFGIPGRPGPVDFLPLPDDAGAGVVVRLPDEPTATIGAARPGPAYMPMVQGEDGQWRLEFLHSGESAKAATVPDQFRGGPGGPALDTPVEFLAPSGKLYFQLDQTGPLQPVTETSPGRYRAPFTPRQLGPGLHPVLLVFRDATAITVGVWGVAGG